MYKQFTTGALAALLILASISQMACGNATTLARIGAIITAGANGYKAELASLHVGGLIADTKFAKLDKQADALIVTSKALADYFNSLPGITKENKAEVVAKIAEAVGLFGGVITNPDLIGAAKDSLAVKIINAVIITLNNASIVVAGLNPPAAKASFAIGAKDGIQPETIHVKAAAVPKGAEKYFK